jgi:pSer/pThr/pTyr-binding forkhead associated (FHA) protein
MKAIERPDDFGSSRPAAEASGSSSIQERLQAVDVSSLDRLLAIRDEQGRIDAYRAKAEALKTSVAEAVHARVIDDYNKRAAALDRQSAPLRAQARTEYRKLRALVDEVDRARERARLEKDELEFRHAVGEFDEAELATRLQAPQQALDRCQTDQAILDEQAVRFLAALGSEEAPTEPGAPRAPEGVAETRFMAAPAPEDRSPVAVTPPDIPVSPPPPIAPPPVPEEEEPPSPDRTLFIAEATRVASPQDVERAKAAVEQAKRVSAVPPAALLLSDSAAAQLEYRLGEINGIGRSDENKIQIVKPGVSRMHAVVTARPNGFAIKDLDSQNGTFVNGDKVAERQLADGDAIEIGTVRFVFRMPWPVAAATAGPSARAQGRR